MVEPSLKLVNPIVNVASHPAVKLIMYGYVDLSTPGLTILHRRLEHLLSSQNGGQDRLHHLLEITSSLGHRAIRRLSAIAVRQLTGRHRCRARHRERGR